jgi:hypothetical protein
MTFLQLLGGVNIAAILAAVVYMILTAEAVSLAHAVGFIVFTWTVAWGLCLGIWVAEGWPL